MTLCPGIFTQGHSLPCALNCCLRATLMPTGGSQCDTVCSARAQLCAQNELALGWGLGPSGCPQPPVSLRGLT